MGRHPWNRGFAWRDRSGPFSALSAEQVRHYDEHGYVVVPDLLPAPLLEQVVARIDGFDAATEDLLREQDDQRFGIAEAGVPTVRVLCTDPERQFPVVVNGKLAGQEERNG